MNKNRIRLFITIILLVCCAGIGIGKGKDITSITPITTTTPITTITPITFTEDFENGVSRWEIFNPAKVKIKDSGDPVHKKVLYIHPGGPGVYALIKGSEEWSGFVVEGDIYFPSSYVQCFGLIYNFDVKEKKPGYGCICLYTPVGETLPLFVYNYQLYSRQAPAQYTGNIIIPFPDLDDISLSYLYPEYWTVVKPESGIKPNEWGHFKAEISGATCHFYLGDMVTPKLTFDYTHNSKGQLGFKSEYTGTGFWLDNVRVSSINGLSYKGEPIPSGITYKTGTLLAKWDVIGPFYRRYKPLETDGFIAGKTYLTEDITYSWKPFETDKRGCVITGNVFDKYGLKDYAYFHTTIESETEKEIVLEFSSTNELHLWVNNKKLVRKVFPRQVAWHDFQDNPEHLTKKIKIKLVKGTNHIVILARGGMYAGDGFFAGFRPVTDKKK